MRRLFATTGNRATPIKRAAAIVGLTIAFTSAVQALTFSPVADEQMIAESTLIVRARVVDATFETKTSGGLTATTRYYAKVLEAFKGDVGGVLTFELPGGDLGDGRFLHIAGIPTLEAGDELLLFLTPSASGYRVTHLNQGLFRAGRFEGERYWTRQLAGAHAITPKAAATAAPTGSFSKALDTASRYTRPRHAPAFEAWLADHARGLPSAVNYLAHERVRPSTPIAKFTLRSFNNLRVRRFDRSEPMTWLRNGDGQAGSPDGGTSAFLAAMRAWNDEPNTPITLADGGTTQRIFRFVNGDGQNIIQFSDVFDEIGSDYSCETGGTIAVNSVASAIADGRHDWKGRAFREISESDITVNDGVSCRADDQAWLETVFTHELGHTIGLGHACGDAISPPCGSDPRLDNAVMRTNIATPPPGARLGADDVAGIRFLYDPSFTAVEPDDRVDCPLPDGHPQFCAECGPCDDGQGDCDRDAECGPGLVCTNNVGAQFGFAPGIDICLADSAPPQPDDPSCPALGSGRFCTACGPCAAGQGDCDSDNECASGLACVSDVGAQFGFAPGVDVCLGSTTCDSTPGRGDFCSACGPCQAGEGDCDSDAECGAGLTCADNVGADFGFAPGVDVCVPSATCSSVVGTADFCSTCGPCASGEGDCDSDAECAPGLRCTDNVGADFGFGANVDVCLP